MSKQSFEKFADQMSNWLRLPHEPGKSSLFRVARNVGFVDTLASLSKDDARPILVAYLARAVFGDRAFGYLKRYCDKVGDGSVLLPDADVVLLARVTDMVPEPPAWPTNEDARNHVEAAEWMVVLDRASERERKNAVIASVAARDPMPPRHSPEEKNVKTKAMAMRNLQHEVRNPKPRTIYHRESGVYNGGFGPMVDLGTKVEVFDFDSIPVVGTDGEAESLPIYWSKFTKDDARARREEIERWIKDVRTYGVYVQGRRVVLHRTTERKYELFDLLKHKGFTFTDVGGPSMKRVKRLLIPQLIRGFLKDGDFSFRVVRGGVKESYDGGSIRVRKSMWLRMCSMFPATDNPDRDAKQVAFALDCVIGSVTFVNADGMTKGHMTVVADEVIDVDFVVHESCLKSEIKFSGGLWFGVNPHGPKQVAHTNIQFISNLPTLFPVKQVFLWGVHQIAYGVHNLMTGKNVEHIREIIAAAVKKGTDLDKMLSTRMMSWALTASGNPLYCSKSLFRSAFQGFTDKIVDFDYVTEWDDVECRDVQRRVIKDDRVSVEIPGSRYAQIFSEMVVRDTGYRYLKENVPLADGQIAYVKGLHSYVVTDKTWLDMIGVHGGCDMDDYFAVVHRVTPDGRKIAVVMRSPMAVGEHSVLELYDPNDLPESYECDLKDPFAEPSVRGWITVDPETFPCRIDEAKRRGKHSCRKHVSVKRPCDYSRQWAVDEFRFGVFNSTSPGGAFNCFFALWNARAKRDPKFPFLKDQIMSMEELIDACTKDRDGSVKKEVEDFQKAVVEWFLESGEPMDRVFAEKRFRRYLSPRERDARTIRTYDGPLTALTESLAEFIEHERTKLYAWQLEMHRLSKTTIPQFLGHVRSKRVEDAWGRRNAIIGPHRFGKGCLRTDENGEWCGTMADVRRLVNSWFCEWSPEEVKYYLYLQNTRTSSVNDMYSDADVVYGTHDGRMSGPSQFYLAALGVE